MFFPRLSRGIITEKGCRGFTPCSPFRDKHPTDYLLFVQMLHHGLIETEHMMVLETIKDMPPLLPGTHQPNHAQRS
jgi:hypothetical protein